MTHPNRRAKDWWRAFRLLGCLVRRPQDIAPYCRFGGLCRQTPLELGMPWWSFGAVTALAERLHPGLTAFEYGSGGSTVFLAARCAAVTAVEDEQGWTDAVRAAIASRSLTHATVLHRPFDFWQTGTFAQSDYLHALNAPHDVIVVDGKEWSETVRDICFWHAEDYIKPGGVIVVDDAWRYPQLRERNRARRFREYRGAGYCRVGVTTTTLFEY